jgi:hypothetical protein
VPPTGGLVIRAAACIGLVMGARPGLTALHVNFSETFKILAVRFRPHTLIRPDKSTVGVRQVPPVTTQFQTIFEALEKPHGEQRRRWRLSFITIADGTADQE